MLQNKTTVLVHSEPVEVWTNGHCRAFGAWKCSKEMVGIGWWDGGTVRRQIRWLLGNDSALWRMKCLMVVGELEGCFWMNVMMSNIQTSEIFTAFEIEIAGSLRRFPKYTLEGQHFAPNLVSFNVLDFLPFYQTIVLSFSWTETEPNCFLLLFPSEHGIYVLSRSQSIFSSAAVSTMSGDHTQLEGLGINNGISTTNLNCFFRQISEASTGCTYVIKTSESSRRYPVEVSWKLQGPKEISAGNVHLFQEEPQPRYKYPLYEKICMCIYIYLYS